MSKRTFRGKNALLLILLSLAALVCVMIFREARQRPNVLWITLDSCRYDHLGCYGYGRAHTPNIDALARQGAAFSQAISQASCTRFSVPSMVTGTYPLCIQAQRLAPKPDESHKTVAEVLKESGYRTLVITQEVPVKASARGFEQIDETAKSTSMRTHSCLQALRDLQDETFFIWLYYWDPHSPYRPPARYLEFSEPGVERKRPGKQAAGKSLRKSLSRDQTGLLTGEIAVLARINFKGGLVPTEADRQHMINLYDAEISYVDAEIGKVMAELETLGLWNNTMVIISADHGEAFGEHAKYYHGLNLYDEVIRVPLITKPPRSQTPGKTLAAQVRNVDIMPTILDYCGAQIPENIDGLSLRPAIEGQQLSDRPAYMETYFRQRDLGNQLLLGYRTGTHKVIYNITQGSGELYDLQKDPGEKMNLLQAPLGEGIEQPIGSLEGQVKEAFLNHVGVESLEQLAQIKLVGKMDKATEEALRALGYIE